MSKLSLKDKMKRLRPFVTFNYDLRRDLNKTLTPQQKSEITRYYKKLTAQIQGKYIVYRPKRADHKKKAQAFTGQRLPKFRAYAIQSPTGAGSVKWKGDEVVIQKKGGFVRTIYPDQQELACNTRAYLEELLNDKKFYIVNSINDWRGGGTKKAIIAKLEAVLEKYGFCEQYDMMDEDEDIDREEYPKETFDITIVEVDLKNQKAFLEYASERREAQRERTEKARKQKVRERSRKRRARGRRRDKGRG